ncbi:HesA/MoeB/ThiF family protein [Neisseria sp. Ec49-e6-T10]|uniref:HesA/MoeB/ThiF family protein n=1 Tax=Neisseria sp. Ec49-e6-T10 TaxID=3140744 RepID=UPI003EC0DCF4
MHDKQLLRYSRHILLKDIDLSGQEKLLSATALVVGCGGLGNSAIAFLASAGIGNLIIADSDTVELSNLQRQIHFKEIDLSLSKAETMAHVVRQQNPDIKVTSLVKYLTETDLIDLMRTCDIVLDCSDNFATRQAINKASVKTKTPLISGAAVRFEGQLTVFDPRQADSPCYACLFNGEDATDGPCATFGVFAPLVGVIGAQQAAEALKIIMSIGTTAIGTLFQYDALNLNNHRLTFKRNPQCTVCGHIH